MILNSISTNKSEKYLQPGSLFLFFQMQLYHETVQVPTSITLCINGNFTGDSRKREEIVIVRGSSFLELLRPDTQTTGRFSSLSLCNTFSIIRGLTAFPFPPNEPSAVDHLALSSDSGCLVVLRYDRKGGWERIYCEAFGKSGLKRGIPGQFLAADPYGRALLLSALERAKLAYFFHRLNAEDSWRLSSPIEVHKNRVLTEALVALDSGNDNPLFAALETLLPDTADEEEREEGEKRLVFYQVQPGLNSASRKASQRVHLDCNFIYPVASGVLVASPDTLSFCRPHMEPVTVALPQRQPTSGYPHRPAIITGAASIIVKDKAFTLLQNEFGDLFRVDLQNDLEVRYFDTVPAGNALILLKSGFLFLAAESTDHCLFQLEGLGEDEPVLQTHYEPRSLKNLVCVSTLVNYGTIANAFVQSDGEVLALRGRGTGNQPSMDILKSSLRILPESQEALEKEYSSLFACNNELVVSGKQGAFNLTKQVATKIVIACGVLANGSIVQVHSDSMRVLDGQQEKFQWTPPPKTMITKAALNERQVVLLLNTSLVLYFELDEGGVLLRENSKTVDLGEQVSSLAIAPVPVGIRRGLLLCVGTQDSLIHLLSLKPESFLEELASQVCASPPTSLLLADDFLHVGLENGVYVKMRVDVVTGALTEPDSRLLGPHLQLGLLKGTMEFEEEHVPYSHVYAVDSLGCLWFEMNAALLRIDGLEGVCNVHLEGESYTALCRTSICKFKLPQMNDSKYSIERIPLNHTGTRIACDEESGLFLVVEGEPVTSLATDVPLWNSGVRVWNHKQRQFVSTIPMMDNEAVTCAAFVRFAARPGVVYLAVGVARDYTLMPRQASLGAIILYLVQADGSKPQVIHRTEFLAASEELLIPASITQFSGRLLCGVGGYLRLYDLGKQRLLLKCSINLPTFAVAIAHQGLRIAVADARASLLIFYYRPDDNRFYLVADEPTCRPPTNTLLALDYDTWAVGDRFGGLAVLKLPHNLSLELDTDPASSRLNQAPAQFAAPLKLDLAGYIHLGSPVIGLGKVQGMHGRSALRYITVDGTQGILAPFITKAQADAVNEVVKEKSVRERASITGRNHAWFRSLYYPAPNIIDGDLLYSKADLQPTVKQVLSTIKSIYNSN